MIDSTTGEVRDAGVHGRSDACTRRVTDPGYNVSAE